MFIGVNVVLFVTATSYRSIHFPLLETQYVLRRCD